MAFDGETQSAVVASLCDSPAPPSGSPAVDRLLAGCLAKHPAARWQRIQKIQLELKLLTAAASRASAPPAAPRAGISDAAWKAELAPFKARSNATLQAREAGVADVQRSASEAVTALHGQFSALGAELAPAREHAGGGYPAIAIETVDEHIVARMQRSIDSLNERVAFLEQNPGTPSGNLTRLETGLAGVREHLSELHTHVAADMHEFELNLKAQSNAIDSARTAMAQTDDLVERVVDALESLQSTVLERSEDRVMALS
jgi:uncharacterized coiled-coil protein SlyX